MTQSLWAVLAGQTVDGNCRLAALLGAGGFGAVYRGAALAPQRALHGLAALPTPQLRDKVHP